MTHPQFSTEESLRYASECKRMAALAHPQEHAAQRSALFGHWAERIGQMFAAPQQPQPAEDVAVAGLPVYS